MIFQKNREALLQVDPALAAKLSLTKANDRFEVYMDEKDIANINIYDKKLQTPLYPTVPIDEITSSYQTFIKQYGRYPLLFIYGIGNGVWLKMILTDVVTRCCLFEPEIELLYIALNLIDFSEEIRSERLKILWQPLINNEVLYQICNNSDIKAFLKTYTLHIPLDYYLHNHQEQIQALNQQIIQQIEHIVIKEGNDATDSLTGLDHHLQNMPKMIESYTLKSLIEAKNSEYAVIVSTGPSLEKQLPLLKKYQNYLTILCVDASLSILQKAQIAPDIVFSLERVEATAHFYEHLDRELLRHTIFAPTSIAHKKLLEHLEGMEQAISMRPFGYTTMFRLSPWGYIGIGLSAANMAFDFAVLAAFKHIAFIGQDLAFGPNGTTHAKGSIHGEKEEQYKPSHTVKGYYGGEVETTTIWQQFRYGIERNITYATKEKGLTIYNCTEGGAYIEGAEHIPFQTFLKSLDGAQPKAPLQPQKVSPRRQAHYLHRIKKLLPLYIQRLQKIKSQVEATFLEVMETIEELESLNRGKELEKIDFDRLSSTIGKIDLIKDIYETDRAVLKFMSITNPFVINAELELARIMVRPSDEEIEKKVKMIDWIYAHKSWLFFLAGALENIIFILQKHQNSTYAQE